MLRIYETIGEEVFGNTKIAGILNCSETTATTYIKKLKKLGIIVQIEGLGKGKYRFI